MVVFAEAEWERMGVVELEKEKQHQEDEEVHIAGGGERTRRQIRDLAAPALGRWTRRREADLPNSKSNPPKYRDIRLPWGRRTARPHSRTSSHR
jgi:hypothetical protein